jgi:galactose-1-phosphate uridylyltransferase
VKIRFTRIVRKAKILTGSNSVEEYRLEHRVDPLTGRLSTVCPGIKEKRGLFFGKPDWTLVKTLAEESKASCPFCPENLQSATARFYNLKKKRLRFGKAWAFPNLYPRAEFEAVAVLTPRHFLGLNQFTPRVLYEGLRVLLECAWEAWESKPRLKYACIGGNYLFPAGASLLHPHFQLIMRDLQFNYVKELSRCSEAYHREQGENYWEALVKQEKSRGERFVGYVNGTYWLTPFAPQGMDEVQAVVLGKSHLLELDACILKGLASGLSKVLKYYDETGLSSFNIALYSEALGVKTEHFTCLLRVISRPNMRENYTNFDGWYAQKLLDETVLVDSPESRAADLRKLFP